MRYLYLLFWWLVQRIQPKPHAFKIHSKRRPASKARHPRKPVWVNTHILHLAAFLPQGTGVRTIASHYNRLQAQHPKPHLRTISKSPVANVQLHHIFGILDHGTRRLLAISVLEAKTAKALNHKVLQTAVQHGLPKNVRTDNESNFKSKRFKRLFKYLGIKHQTTDLGCPWQNGRIERLWGTLKQQLNQIQVQNASDLQTRLNEFAIWYNEARPHQHLGGLTPMEAWDEIDPYDEYRSPQKIEIYSGWDGMLTGLRHRW